MVSSTHIPSEFWILKITQAVPLSQGMKQGLFLNTFKTTRWRWGIEAQQSVKIIIWVFRFGKVF